MSVHVLGAGTLVATDGIIKMWAQHGQICIEDSRDNSFSTITILQARQRLQALREASGTIANPGCEMLLSSFGREKIRRFVADGEEVVKQAERQGPPGLACTTRDFRLSRPRSVYLGSVGGAGSLAPNPLRQTRSVS